MTESPPPLVSTSTESGLDVALHPLPLLNISEHYTRTRLEQDDPGVRVVGALLGTQVGRELEITNSFEFTFQPDTLDIDHEFLSTRKEQFKQVFPTYEILGWYSSGIAPTLQDLHIHQQLLPYNENPLFLQLSPNSVHDKELPLVIYEFVTEIVNNQPSSSFIKAPYRVETGEAERIAVDHAAKPSGSGTGEESTYVSNLITQRNALKMLSERVAVIQAYLDKLSHGLVPKDHETLRQISALISSLPAADSQEFSAEYMTEYSDVLLTCYLASMTEALGPFNDLMDRFAVAQSGTVQAGGGGRMKGR